MSNMSKKPTVKIMINVYNTDCGQQIYKVCDAYDHDSAPDCCMGSGWYTNQYAIDDDIENWKKDYNIIIDEDYRN